MTRKVHRNGNSSGKAAAGQQQGFAVWCKGVTRAPLHTTAPCAVIHGWGHIVCHMLEQKNIPCSLQLSTLMHTLHGPRTVTSARSPRPVRNPSKDLGAAAPSDCSLGNNACVNKNVKPGSDNWAPAGCSCVALPPPPPPLLLLSAKAGSSSCSSTKQASADRSASCCCRCWSC